MTNSEAQLNLPPSRNQFAFVSRPVLAHLCRLARGANWSAIWGAGDAPIKRLAPHLRKGQSVQFELALEGRTCRQFLLGSKLKADKLESPFGALGAPRKRARNASHP
jgi:hypothetical protein